MELRVSIKLWFLRVSLFHVCLCRDYPGVDNYSCCYYHGSLRPVARISSIISFKELLRYCYLSVVKLKKYVIAVRAGLRIS